MMRPQPMIALTDVEAGSRWFQDVLGVASGHGGPDYEMLMDGDELVAQLHQWEADEHPHLGDAGDPSRGNGVVLWFTTDDWDAQLARVEATTAEILDGPPTTRTGCSMRSGCAAPRATSLSSPAPRPT